MIKFDILPQSKIKISTGNDRQSIEIGDTAVKSGFLNLLPGSSLAIFIYIITHLEHNNFILTNPTIITNNLPYNIEEVKEGLEYLQDQEIIDIDKNREGDYTYKIYLNPNQLFIDDELEEKKEIEEAEEKVPKSTIKSAIKTNKAENKFKIRDQVIGKKEVTRDELKKALASFIPQGKNPILIRNGIEQWLDDFEPRQIKELVRRVDKWSNNQKNSPEKAFYYLQGIIDDWYEKDIFTYKKLKHFDQLYREVRELAAAYGLNKWHKLNSTQMETFKGWISDDNALSANVAKFAIQEAIRRKKDGQPSLKYIEDNFIIPWKKVGIRNIHQAKNLLAKNRTKYKKSNSYEKQESTKKEDWNDFSWDFAEFKES